MKRSRLEPGRKSLERGSTFANHGQGLTRAATPRRRTPISAASPEQRAKVRDRGSIISGNGPCDPAHLWPRGMGGCDHEDCVVPLTHDEHRAYDDGHLDLLPYLIANGCWVELAHMVEVHHVDPIAMLNKLTGERWAPERREAA